MKKTKKPTTKDQLKRRHEAMAIARKAIQEIRLVEVQILRRRFKYHRVIGSSMPYSVKHAFTNSRHFKGTALITWLIRLLAAKNPEL
jgi:hypothetical protein